MNRTTDRLEASRGLSATAPLDASIPGRFATSIDVSPPDDKEVLTVSQITNFRTGCETSREVAKRLAIEMSKGAKRPGGELAK